MKPTIDLVTVKPEDARNFRIGMRTVWRTTAGGEFRQLTGLALLMYDIRQRAHSLTRWWRPRCVVSAIDEAEGVVTISLERWSWRRWRWERVA